MNMEATRVMNMSQSRERLTVQWLQGKRGLEAIRPAWHELVEQVKDLAFYHQYAWYENYVYHLERDPERMLFALVSRDAKIVAILPLVYRNPTWPGGLRLLQVPSHAYLCVADGLIRHGEDHGRIMNRLIRQLYRSGAPGWDELLFPESPAGSCVDSGLCNRSRVLMVRETAHGSDYIPNAGGYEATMQRLSGSFRRDLRRKRKHAEKGGTLTYRCVESPEKLDRAFREFLEVESSGWKGQDGTRTAINCDPEIENFYWGLMHARTPSSYCVINLLYLNDTCIAAEFCLYCNGVLSILKIGYREDHARVSPGSLLFDCVLNDWCERPGFRAVNLVGNAAWQKTWHPEVRPVYRYRVYNRTWRAFFARFWRAFRPSLVYLRDAFRKLRQSVLNLYKSRLIPGR